MIRAMLLTRVCSIFVVWLFCSGIALSQDSEAALKIRESRLRKAETETSGGVGGAYSAICSGSNSGSVVQGVHSTYDSEKKERKIEVLCSNLLDSGLSHPDGLEWQGRNWQWTKRRLDIPEAQVFGSPPKSWVGGCKNYEILVGINSVVWEGVRRFEFVCVEYLTVRVDQSSCRLLSPTTLKQNFVNFSTVAEEKNHFGPFVFRAVRATYDPASRDREFELETCQVFTVPKWPVPQPGECRFRRVTLNNEEISKIRAKVFGKMRSADEQECAQMCAAHPFCTSFIWGPGLSLPTMLTCEMSYEKYDKDFCRSATIFETGFSHRRDYFSVDDRMIGVPCLECPMLEPAERLLDAPFLGIRRKK